MKKKVYEGKNKKYKTICLTFDVEDWFQVENLRRNFPIDTWDEQTLRLEGNVNKILDLLDEKNIKATFFVLGYIAKRIPTLVKEINGRGHEIASHGMWHRLNTSLEYLALKEDIKSSKYLLEDIIGKEVIGYRAPSFSVNEELLYLLNELGFKYDSSYNNFSINKRYGKLIKHTDKPAFMHKSGIQEFEMPTLKFFNDKIHMPISGGGYFRLYPSFVFNRAVEEYIKNNDNYTFYMHPWELDYQQPRIKDLKLNYKIRQYVGLKNSYGKLKSFIDAFYSIKFSTLAQQIYGNGKMRKGMIIYGI